MMLFIFCETCGIPLRPPVTKCARCRPAGKQGQRRITKKVTPRDSRQESA